jgi:molybdopterin-containing oxidoreductase family iron-sulfur binding subunit
LANRRRSYGARRSEVRGGDRKVNLVVHSGLFLDETATLSHWHIPAAHYLEAWSDARTIDGTVSIVQLLILPLYGGKSAHEVIATLSEKPERAAGRRRREFGSQQAVRR